MGLSTAASTASRMMTEIGDLDDELSTRVCGLPPELASSAPGVQTDAHPAPRVTCAATRCCGPHTHDLHANRLFWRCFLTGRALPCMFFGSRRVRGPACCVLRDAGPSRLPRLYLVTCSTAAAQNLSLSTDIASMRRQIAAQNRTIVAQAAYAAQGAIIAVWETGGFCLVQGGELHSPGNESRTPVPELPTAAAKRGLSHNRSSLSLSSAQSALRHMHFHFIVDAPAPVPRPRDNIEEPFGRGLEGVDLVLW